MSDNAQDDIQLSIGFDTQKVADGADLFVKKMEEVQTAAKKTEAVNKASLQGMSDDQVRAMATSEQAAREGERQRTQAALEGAKQRARIAEEEREQRNLYNGKLAQEYVAELERQFKSNQAMIQAQVAQGLLNQKGAKDAGRQNAAWYRGELLAGMQSDIFTMARGPGGQDAVVSAGAALTSLEKLDKGASLSSLGLGRLRYSLISMASTMTGIPPIVGRVGGALSLLAMPMTTLLVLLGVIAGLGYAWHNMEQPQKDVTAAQEKYNEVLIASNKRLDEFKSRLGDLSHLGPDPVAKSIREIQDELKKVSVGDGGGPSSQKSSMIGAWTELRNPSSIYQVLKASGAIDQAGEAFKRGTITAKQYGDELEAIGTKYPKAQDLVAPWIEAAGATEGLRRKLQEVTAEANQAAAKADDMFQRYGKNAYAGEAIHKSEELRAQLAAAQTGGRKAVALVQAKQEGEDRARALWEAYVRTEEGFAMSNQGKITFDAARRDNGAVGTKANEVLAQATAEADIAKKVSAAEDEYNKRLAEQKRIKEELFRVNRTFTNSQSDQQDSAQDLQQRIDAARMGSDAYARLDHQLTVDAEVKRALRQVDESSRDSQTHALLISERELELRKQNTEAAIREKDAKQQTLSAAQGNAAQRQEIQNLYDEAAAHLRGKDAVAAENVELQYQKDLKRANAIEDTTERDTALRLAAERRDAALYKEQVTERYDQEKKASDKAAQDESQERVKVYNRSVQEMSKVFGEFLSGAYGKGHSLFQSLWDDMKSTFIRAIADMLATVASRKMLGSLAGVFNLGGGGGALASFATNSNFGRPGDTPTSSGTTMGYDNSVYTSDMLAKAHSSTPTLAQQGLGYAGIGLAAFTGGHALGGALYNPGQSNTANNIRGGFAGAAQGAAMGAMIGSVVPGIGTAIGAVVGGAIGLIGGLLGVGAAAKQAKQQLEDMRKTLADNLLQLRASINQGSDSLEYAIAQVTTQFDGLKDQTNKAYPGRQNETERNAVLAELNQLEQKRIEQLKQEAAQQKQQAYEDLQVRLLVAQGHDKEAATLELQLQQQREYDQYVKSGADAVTLALLKQVQAQEAVKAATDSTTSALLNVPDAYRVNRAVYEFASATNTGRRSGGPTDLGGPVLDAPKLGGGSAVQSDQAVVLMLDGKVLASATVKQLKSLSQKQYGNTTDWGKVTVT